MAARTLPPKFVCVDVECVATGHQHDARSVALVAVVDQQERVLLKKKVKPVEKIVSYLTPLTGLREGDLDDGEPLDCVLTEVKRVLGSDVVLIGQGVKSDIAWLKLREGEDYESSVDLGELFKTYNPRYSNYNFFSLAHEANTLLRRGTWWDAGVGLALLYRTLLSTGFIADTHDPATDAKASIQLFKKYYADSAQLQQAKQQLLRNRPPPSWAKQNNYRWEGVCMAAFMPAKCFCGAPIKKTS